MAVLTLEWKEDWDSMTLSCVIGFKECCWPNPWNFSDDLCSLSLKIRHKQCRHVTIKVPIPVLRGVSLNCSLWFPLGLLGGNSMYKHLTAMPQVPWLWKLFYSHEALRTEIRGCWKSWFPFSVGGMVVEHRGMTLGLTGAVTLGMATALPHWRVMVRKWTHPDSPAVDFIFIMLSIFCNEMESRLENLYWEEKYWASKHRQFREESECHLCAVKTQRTLYNLLSALCLCSHCVIHAHKFGTQLVPLSKTQSSNEC